MLLDGFNHVAVLTNDTDRLHSFYREVFDAEVEDQEPGGPGRPSHLHPCRRIRRTQRVRGDGNTEPQRQTPMFGRGRIDHLGLQAASLEAFEEIRDRLMARGAADEFRDRFRPGPQCLLPRP